MHIREPGRTVADMSNIAEHPVDPFASAPKQPTTPYVRTDIEKIKFVAHLATSAYASEIEQNSEFDEAVRELEAALGDGHHVLADAGVEGMIARHILIEAGVVSREDGIGLTDEDLIAQVPALWGGGSTPCPARAAIEAIARGKWSEVEQDWEDSVESELSDHVQEQVDALRAEAASTGR